MRRTLWALGLALMLLGNGLVRADEAASLYGELVKRSGVETQLALVPDLIIQSFRQEAVAGDKTLLPGDVIDEVAREVRKAFSPGVMRAVITARLRGNLSEADARAALKWLDGPVGRKATRLEEAASSPEAQKAIEQFAATLDKNPMSRQQVDLIKHLTDAMQSVDAALDTTLDIQKAVAAAALAASEQGDMESLPLLFERIDKRRDEMRFYFEKTILISNLYTYQSLSVEELQAYKAFVKSPAGKQYHRTMFAALRQATTQAALRLGSALGRLSDRVRSRKAS